MPLTVLDNSENVQLRKQNDVLSKQLEEAKRELLIKDDKLSALNADLEKIGL